MHSLFYDKRLIPSHKKKSQKKDLPELKHPFMFVKRVNNSIAHQSEHFKVLPYYPLLSNVLVSKKIDPPPPPRLLALIRQKDHSQLFHNFRFRQQSAQSKYHRQKLFVNAEHKRSNTSLSIRDPSEKNLNETEDKTTELSNLMKQSKEFVKQTKFIVFGSKNNEDMVRTLLRKRSGWKEIAQGEGIPDFKWLFFKGKFNFKKMNKYHQKRAVNHFEFNHQICTKDALIKNLQFYCQTKKIELFRITPVTFVLDFDNEYCEFNLKQFLSFFQKNDPRVQKSQPLWQLIPTLQCYMSRQNPDIKKKMTNFCRPFSSNCYFSQENYLWLLKPTGLNRGRGIELFNSLEQLEQKLLHYFDLMKRKKFKYLQKNTEKKQENQGSQNLIDLSNSVQKPASRESSGEQKQEREQINDSADEDSYLTTKKQGNFNGESYELEACSFVIQKYIEKPMLIHGRKFDIRVWALLTHKMQLFFYKRAYIRMSGQPYEINNDNLSNPFVHFTNNAIQKYSPNYGQFQEGNQLPFQWLVNQLPQVEVAQIWEKIKQITHMAFSSVKKKINQFSRQYCFELFGLDFMIDFEKKVWLIQVNENPCLECSSPLLAQIIPNMVDGAFNLTLDSIFAGRQAGKQQTKPVGNQWQLLGRLSANCEYVPPS